jgi:hypothetical protein
MKVPTNLTYEFLDAQSVDVAVVDVEFEPEEFGGEFGLGGTYEWSGGKFAIHGEALGQTSFEDSYGVNGNVGFSTRSPAIHTTGFEGTPCSGQRSGVMPASRWRELYSGSELLSTTVRSHQSSRYPAHRPCRLPRVFGKGSGAGSEVRCEPAKPIRRRS